MTVRDGHGATRHLPCVPSVEYNHATTSVECDVAGLDVQMQEASFVPCFDRLAGHATNAAKVMVIATTSVGTTMSHSRHN